MKVILSMLKAILPASMKKQLLMNLGEWAVKSTKTKLDDKIWDKVKDKI